MKKRLLNCSIIASTLIFIFASVGFAECPMNKVAITIANPAGKIIEICVPASAVGQIGGPNDIVIPATCPCFSQETVESAINADPSIQCHYFEGNNSSGPCKFGICMIGNNYGNASFMTVAADVEGGRCNWGNLPAAPLFVNFCTTQSTDNSFITEEAADACVAILKTFVP